MSISPRFLEDLRDRLTLSEVIASRIKLTRAGREFKACCPFHSEKSPSFYVNDDKQFFHCFGCGAHGDVLGFVMRHDNLSFIEGVEQLAQKAGLQMPRQTFQDVEQSRKDKSLFALCEDTAKFFEAQLALPANHVILDYMLKRKLSADTLASFRIGYAPADEQALRQYLGKLDYTDAQMIEAGVLKASTKEGRPPYAFFRDRVMFPVTDPRGRVIAFGGRVLPEHIRPLRDPTNKPPKYINSADTPLFHKGRLVYAQQHARLAANDHPIIVVEGYMDAIACHQAGFRGAVAPLGTALTEEQIMVLWKMIPHDRKEPVLCFDGDAAGYRAAVRAVDRVLPLLKPDQSVRFAFLPEGDDPDTFIQEQGNDAFKQLITKSISALDFIWTHHTAGQKFDTPETRAGLQARLDEISSRVPDSQLQYHYKQAFRDKTRALFGGTFTNKVAKGGKFAAPLAPKVVLPPLSKKRSSDLVPQVLLLTLINHPGIYPSIHEQFHQLDAGQPELQRVYDALHDLFEGLEPEALDRQAVLGHITALGLADIVDRLASERLYIHAGFARPDADPEKVLEGWKSFWGQWDNGRLREDIDAALAALRASLTPENEDRIRALQQIQMDKDTGTT